MKRKIIKLGQATFVASLPSKWIREYDLKQGDYLEMEQKDNSLIVSTKPRSKNLSTEIDLRKIPSTRLILSLLQAKYSLGYDKITVFHDQYVRHYKGKDKGLSTQIIQEIVAKRLIGAEVVEQDVNKSVIADLGGLPEGGVDNILKRVAFLIKTYTTDVVAGISNNDKDLLEQLVSKHDIINRFLVYYQRISVKIRLNPSTKLFTGQLIQHMKQITGTYNLILKNYILKPAKYSKPILDLFSQFNASIQQSLLLSLNFSIDKAGSFLTDREKMWQEINGVLENSEKYSKSDLVLFGLFQGVMANVYGIMKSSFLINQMEEIEA
jgi:phosphate uptake regulator